MHFIDEVVIRVRAGDGGKGAVAFRREKFVPLGGPSGGDGGDGGSVILVVDEGLSTLLDFRYKSEFQAPTGEAGANKDRYGRGGEDVVLRVPPGTQVFDQTTGELICDLQTNGQRFVAAQGGRGGRGNIHFATSTDRAPRRSEPGTPAEERTIRLELKLLADVGLLGFPNVGKSSLISRISAARPKIANYPFTTLVPNLGTVGLSDERSFVVADIPGLIEGAHAGAGLGDRFLRHLERTRLLVHLLDPSAGEGTDRTPLRDFDATNKELRALQSRAGEAAPDRGDQQDRSAGRPEEDGDDRASLQAARDRAARHQRRHGRRGRTAPRGDLASLAPPGPARQRTARPAWPWRRADLGWQGQPRRPFQGVGPRAATRSGAQQKVKNRSAFEVTSEAREKAKKAED